MSQPNLPIQPPTSDGGGYFWSKTSGTWQIMFPLLAIAGVVAGNIAFSGDITFNNGVNITNGQLNYSGHISTLPSNTGTLCQTNQTGNCGPGSNLLSSNNKWTGTNLYTQQISLNNGNLNFSNHVSTLPGTTGTICQVNQTGPCGAGSTGTVTINGLSRSVFTGIQANTTKGIVIDGFNRTTFTNVANTTVANTFTANVTFSSPIKTQQADNETTNSTAQNLAGAQIMTGTWIYVTPKNTGQFLVHMSGIFSNNVQGDSGNIQVNYGTGNAPRGGSAMTGTIIGVVLNPSVGLANQQEPVTISYIVKNLSINTRYWIETAGNSNTGTSSLITSMLYAQEK